MKLPDLSDAFLDYSRDDLQSGADDLFEGVMWRRVFAFLIDLSLIGVILAALWGLVFVTLFLLSPVIFPLMPLVPIIYHTLMIGGRKSATVGMQFMDIEVRDHSGRRPGLLQAFAMTALFYVSVSLTSLLILLVALFNDRRHCAHDYLSGTVVINSDRID